MARSVDNLGDQADEVAPSFPRLPDIATLPQGGLRFIYDEPTDTLSVDFFGRALPAVSVAVDRGDRDSLYLRVDPETGRVVGLQIEAFLSYAAVQDPPLMAALTVAELRGVDELAALNLRREARLAAVSDWNATAFFAGIGHMIASARTAVVAP